MSYLVWKDSRNTLVNYAFIESMEILDIFIYHLKNHAEENNYEISNIKVVNLSSLIKIGEEWFINGQKTFEPYESKLNREYEEMIENNFDQWYWGDDSYYVGFDDEDYYDDPEYNIPMNIDLLK